MKRVISIFIFIFWSISLFATHNRAGEITYCTDSNNPLKLNVTVTTYTDPLSVAADRCEIEIDYGDGTIDTIPRVNNGSGTSCSCPGGGGNCGQLISPTVKKNIYVGSHIYSGSSTYILSVNDPNRNEGILNIPNSVNTTFYVKDTVIINNWLGANCSPVLNFPPIDNGCAFEIFQHSPGAIDPDGDSLDFSLIPCSAPPPDNDGVLDGYVYPNEVSGNIGTSLTIDRFSGLVEWDSPQIQGEYNFCILIREYRNGIQIGSVVRDMQVTILPCNNDPPDLIVPTPLCVVAGNYIDTTITATDPNGNTLELTTTGTPYILSNNPANFDTISGNSPISSDFTWQTNCSHVSNTPYQVFFRVEDDGGGSGVNLVRYKTMDITVLAPAPKNLTASPLANSVVLNWDASFCSNAIGYNIYSKIDSSGWCPNECESGVAESSGFTLVGSVTGLNNTTFTDDGNGQGLLHGYQYCYVVTAYFSDGSESIATCEVCTELIKDVPIITHVTINSTDASTGSDSIKWSFPLDLDTSIFKGPYHYKVLDETNTVVGQTNSDLNLYNVDTFFVHNNTNTSIQKNYSVQFYYGDTLIGGTQIASSVFLSTAPTDNKIILSWTESVPWANTSYIVLRYNNSTALFDTIDTVTQQQYIDSNLINGKEYCYYVTSVGGYSANGFTFPLFNRSQEACDIPIDNIAPCSPIAPEINSDCMNLQNNLNWTNPNNICADDVVGYNIYYAPLLGQELLLIDSIRDASIVTFDQNLTGSVAGCYAVSAIDTFYNESPLSEILCVDNCSTYELPAVFSPGTDGNNDLFRPFPYMFVESIDIQIYNRWGNVVFTATNPDILWDGANQTSKKICTSGVYYYICKVNEYRLTGIESRTLTGYIHLIREDGQ